MNISSTYRIFLIEDDPFYNEYLAYHIGLNPQLEIFRFSNASEALSQMHLQPHIVTFDFYAAENAGELIVRKLKESDTNIFILLISSGDTIPSSFDLIKMGVYEYLPKDTYTTDRLWNTLNNICLLLKTKEQLAYITEHRAEKYNLNEIVAESHCMQTLLPQIKRCINTSYPLLISGEKGTGKCWMAKTIHYSSSRKKDVFLHLNVAEMEPEEIETTLFGFTSMYSDGRQISRIGKIEEARGGSLYLEGFPLIASELKEKIYKFIVEQNNSLNKNEFVPSTRFIFSSTINLDNLFSKNIISKDMYLLLSNCRVHMPLLRKRKKDMVVVAKMFIEDYAKKKCVPLKILSSEASTTLIHHEYAGNFAELREVIHQAMELSNTIVIGSEDISFPSTPSSKGFMNANKSLREYTNAIVQHYLDANDGDVVVTSEVLDIGKSTIYKLIQERQVVLRKRGRSFKRKTSSEENN